MEFVMRISIINFSDAVDDDALQTTVRAVNRQVAEDFVPRWMRPAQLVVVAATGDAPAPELLTSDAAIYISTAPSNNNVGYHDRNKLGMPFGFVFTDLAEQLGQAWSITLSHEVLEMLVDPQLNTLKVGPDPRNPALKVSFMQEVCDPVQSTSYAIDGVAVSNFVTPDYYVVGAPVRSTNRLGLDLAPFGVWPGGYVQYTDAGGIPQRFGPAAEKVLALKTKFLGKHRRARRHAVTALHQQAKPPRTTAKKKGTK